MSINGKEQQVQHTSAVVAGISLLVMAIFAGISYGYVHSSLIVAGDALTSLQNIQSSGSLFALGIFGWLMIIITDLLVSWAITVYLRPIHHDYASLVGWLRLLYTVILAIAVSHLVIANSTAQGSDFLLTMEMTASQVMGSITSFEAIWSWGLIIFGLHLIGIGFVTLKAQQIPKIISILVSAAGFSYVLIHLMDSFLPQLERVTSLLETILMVPMTIGELAFGLWLLIKGRKLEKLD